MPDCVCTDIPVREHFDSALVRMYKDTFEGEANVRTFNGGDFKHAGRGVLCGILQGRPVEARSPFQLHAESSHIMSAKTLRHVFDRSYGAPTRWRGDLTSRSLLLLEREGFSRTKSTRFHLSYFDRVQLGFGALMRDAGVPLLDWTSAYRSPYWNHQYVSDFTGAAHNFSVPLERVLFAPIQWLFTKHIRLCCSPADCNYQHSTSCYMQRETWSAQPANGCCPRSVSTSDLRLRKFASVPRHARAL